MSGSVGKLSSVFVLVTVLGYSGPIPTHDSQAPGRATPAVISTQPVAQTVRAGPHHTIEVRFDRAIDPQSVNQRSVYVFGRWSGVASGTFSFEEAGTVLRFVRDHPFFAGEWVTVSLSRAIRAADGTSAAHAYSWNYWIAMDIATANHRGRPGGNVSTLRNDGTGAFERDATIPTDARGEKTCASADANGDGILDLFVGAYGSREIEVFLGDGAGGLSLATKVAAGGSPWTIVAGDMNGDGHVDVVSANRREHRVSVLLGDGTGKLTDAASYEVGQEPVSVDIGDLDGDGDLDVVTSNLGTADFTVYENLGRGALANPRALAARSAGSCAIIHDRDNDGDLDITAIDEIDDLVFLFENPGPTG